MRIKLCLLLMCCLYLRVAAQELYVSTEPASNMPAKSVGLRLNTKVYDMKYGAGHAYRFGPEIMAGVSKKLMLHLSGYFSDMYQPNLKAEGGSIYGKYRFFSIDGVHTHLRIAGFAKFSLISNPAAIRVGDKSFAGDEIDLDGNNSGMNAGIICTQLLHKLALSGSASFANRWDNPGVSKIPGQSLTAADYTLSVGWLLWPKTYTGFNNTNVNLYCELLGSSSLDKKASYIDVAPAIQFVFRSISRLDFSYRTQLTGSMERLYNAGFLLRFEYNFLNVIKNR